MGQHIVMMEEADGGRELMYTWDGVNLRSLRIDRCPCPSHRVPYRHDPFLRDPCGSDPLYVVIEYIEVDS